MKKTTAVMFATMVAMVMVSTTAHAKDNAPAIPVYLVEPGVAAQFTDAALTRRIDSTNDLREKLADKEKVVRLINARDTATIVLEVLDNTEAEEIAGKRAAVLGQALKDGIVKVVVVRMTIGTYTNDVIGRDVDNRGGTARWGLAAKDAANQIEGWIKTNRGKLTAPTLAAQN
jgi:hypothetical protein